MSEETYIPISPKLKSETGTWLSAIAQERRSIQPGARSLPSDLKHRRYIGALGKSFETILKENSASFRKPLEETFLDYGAALFLKRDRSELLKSFLRNCPISVNSTPIPEELRANYERSEDGQIIKSQISLDWIEKLELIEGRLSHKDLYLFHLRAHSKGESFHDSTRPVYCINLRKEGKEFFNLRLMVLISEERQFLERAAATFARESDAFSGRIVTDNLGRTYIDDRIIRRAAYVYGLYQEELKSEDLYRADGDFPVELRHAHFLVMRSHLPELFYDDRSNIFFVETQDEQRSREAA